jgi:hypothetical protein
MMMIGHKSSTVKSIINSITRRGEIEEVIGLLKESKSHVSPALVTRARRLTHHLEDPGDQVAEVCVYRKGSVGQC